MNSSQGLNLNVTALHQQHIVALYVVQVLWSDKTEKEVRVSKINGSTNVHFLVHHT